MHILFLSLGRIKSLNEYGIYTDLLRKFVKEGHSVYIISPIEKRVDEAAGIRTEGNATFLSVKIGNITKTSTIEKGISTLLIEKQVLHAIKKNLSDVKFDLVLYPTPPITFYQCVKYIKKRDGAKSYLMLKDIFPQNAVDIGILSKHGIKGVIYRYFRNKEKKLYSISDTIGCMSQANVDYVIKHNPYLEPAKIEICPNAIEPRDLRLTENARMAVRDKYGIPKDKTIFVYGGNLGKPQGIPFIIECIDKAQSIEDAFFLIVGSGTEYHKIEEFVKEKNPNNLKLMKAIPKEDYDRFVASCDVGLIFLDYRFTIPNFPSRLLSYMQAGLPVLAATDPNTDIGKVIENGGFGWWCESNDVGAFIKEVNKVEMVNRSIMGDAGFEYFRHYFSVDGCYQSIMAQMNNGKLKDSGDI